MAKGKTFSIRLEEEDWEIAKRVSGIEKPQVFIDKILSEFVLPFKKPLIPQKYLNDLSKIDPKAGDRVALNKVKVEIPSENTEVKEAPKNASDDDYRRGYRPTDDIQKQIEAILAEKIPKERDTTMGRKMWNIEQEKRISELRKLIAP